MSITNRRLLLAIALLFLFQCLIYPVLAEDEIVVEYFYSSKCGSCREYSNVIEELEQNYTDNVVFRWLDIKDAENWSKLLEYDLEQRMTATDALESPWLHSYSDTLQTNCNCASQFNDTMQEDLTDIRTTKNNIFQEVTAIKERLKKS